MTMAPVSGHRVRVLYVQYTNPAVYPPLLHSIGLLTDAGCEVRLVGLDTMDRDLAIEYPAGVTARLLPVEPPGWRQKVSYARFAQAARAEAMSFRPDWIYASDALSTPVTRLLTHRAASRLVYHEHDAPAESWTPQSVSWFMRRVMTARLEVARQADICVIPNAARADTFRATTGCRQVAVVWNCPRRVEAAERVDRAGRSGMRVLFRGSIVPARLPFAVVDALALLPADVELFVAGYETLGSVGYVSALLEHARLRSVQDRVHYAGVLTYAEILNLTSSCDVGLALLPDAAADPNEANMAGASNKVFEYLSRGLPVLIGGREEWCKPFEAAGVARACDRDSAESIAAALRAFYHDAADRRAMGERGRQRVLDDWNYETQFEPVLRVMIGARPSLRDRTG